MNREIKQSIAINAGYDSVFNELLLWGQSRWWPKNSLMRLENLSGEIKEKTLYLQKVGLPFAPSWHTRNEVVDKDKLYIKRTFLDGMFEGYEELSVLKSKDVSEAVYNFDYKIKGVFNKLMWKLVFKKLHIRNIDLILESLKKHLERKR